MTGFLQIGNQQNHPLSGISNFYYTVSQVAPEEPGVEGQIHFVCGSPRTVYLNCKNDGTVQYPTKCICVMLGEDTPAISINLDLYVSLGKTYYTQRSGTGIPDTDRIAAYVFLNGEWIQFSEAAS